MKITDIKVIPVQAPGRTLVPVLVDTDEGTTGLGEAGLQRRWHAIAGTVEHMKQWLIGQDPRRIEYLWQRMFRGGFYPGDRLVGSAISAIDTAMWDIKAKVLGVPVYELLGGHCRDHVDVFTGVAYGVADVEPNLDDLLESIELHADAQATADLAEKCAEAGHRYFRLGLPVRVPPDQFDSRWATRRLIDQLRAVRDRVGEQLELMVDLHGRLSPDESVWFCNEVEPLEMFVVEDPIRSEHLGGYERLRQQTRVPLAAGEQWAHLWEFRAAIEGEWVDYVRPDLCICGGLSAGRKIAAMAETHLIKLLCHNPLGPVCTATSVQLDLACDNAGAQEVLFPPDTTLPDMFKHDLTIDDMRIMRPTATGIGVELDEAGAAAHPADMTEPPHFHRPDGSFTNY